MKKKVSRKFFGGPADDMSTASAGRAMPQPGIGMGRGRGMEMRNANAMPGSRPGGTLPPVPSTGATGVMPTLPSAVPAGLNVPAAARPFGLKKGGKVAKKAPKFASGGSLRGYGISKKIKPSGPMC